MPTRIERAYKGLWADLYARLQYVPATVPAQAASGAAAGRLTSDLVGAVFSIVSGNVAVNSSTGALTTTTTAPVGGTIAAKVRVEDASNTLAYEIDIAIPISLPTFPIANNSKIIFLGHSYIGGGVFSNYLSSQTGTQGLQGYSANPLGVLNNISAINGSYNIDIFASANNPWLTLALNPTGLELMDGAEQGINGDHIVAAVNGFPGITARIPYCLTLGPQALYIDIGVNDIDIGLTSQGDNSPNIIIPALMNAVNLILAGGVPLFIKTIATGLTLWPPGDIRYTYVNQVNNAIVALEGTQGVVVLDCRTVDNVQTINGIAAYDSGGLHPTWPLVRAEVQQVIAPAFAANVIQGDNRNLNPLSISNVFPFPGTPGTAGTKNTGVTGVVATGMALQRNAGSSTYVGSKQLISAGNEYQVIDVTPVNDGTAIHEIIYKCQADLSLATLGFTPGTWFVAYVPVALDNWAGWQINTPSTPAPVSFFNEIYNTSSTKIWAADQVLCPINTLTNPEVFTVKVLVPPTGLNPSILKYATQPIQIRHRADAGVIGTTGRAIVGSFILEAISNPMTTWNLGAPY